MAEACAGAGTGTYAMHLICTDGMTDWEVTTDQTGLDRLIKSQYESSQASLWCDSLCPRLYDDVMSLSRVSMSHMTDSHMNFYIVDSLQSVC